MTILRVSRLQEALARRVTLTGHSRTVDYTCPRCGGKECDFMDTGRRDIGKVHACIEPPVTLRTGLLE
jgi:hypothetical protein